MTAVEKSLDDISSIDSEEIDDKDKGQGKTIEETYKKTTQREHILLRPDTYGMHNMNLNDFARHLIPSRLTRPFFRDHSRISGAYHTVHVLSLIHI